MKLFVGWVGVNVRNDNRLAVLGHPACNPLAHLEAHGLKHLSGIAYGNGKVQLALGVIHHEQRPGIRAKVFRHLLHDGLQHGVEVQRRRQRLGDVVKNSQFTHLALTFGGGGLRHNERCEIITLTARLPDSLCCPERYLSTWTAAGKRAIGAAEQALGLAMIGPATMPGLNGWASPVGYAAAVFFFDLICEPNL